MKLRKLKNFKVFKLVFVTFFITLKTIYTNIHSITKINHLKHNWSKKICGCVDLKILEFLKIQNIVVGRMDVRYMKTIYFL